MPVAFYEERGNTCSSIAGPVASGHGYACQRSDQGLHFIMGQAVRQV